MTTDSQPIVVDANAVIMACDTGMLDSLAQAHRLVAPSLMWIECCSTLHRRMRRARRSDGPERVAYEQICAARIERSDKHARGVPWDLAGLLGWHKTSDAEYLGLATAIGGAIFTFDTRMADGARRLAIPVVVPE